MISELSALVSVIVIDLVLAGDNAIVVGMAASGLSGTLRRKAIVIGIAAAAVLRIIFALFATQLLNVIGLVLIGGFLLLWVCWKLWREVHQHAHAGAEADGHLGGPLHFNGKPKTLRQALTQIVVADVSMSLDNVLAVAGTARHHLWVLVIGLALSVALMGVAANFVASLLKRYPWISYAGLILIAWVALAMIWEGSWQAWHGMNGMIEHAPPLPPPHPAP